MNKKIEFDQIVNQEELEGIKLKKSKYKNAIESTMTDDFMEKLHTKGEKLRNKMREQWEEKGGKGRPPSKLSYQQVASVLKQNTRVVLLKSNEQDDVPPVYIYMKNKGVYSSNRSVFNRFLRMIEPKQTSHDQKESFHYLRDTAEFTELTQNRYKIPVKNGIFNLKTKKLEPFTSKEVFTTKVDTNYISDPVHPKLDDGWNVEEWLMQVSNNDEEVSNLLWQVIADSINGNYTRKRSIWLVGDGANGKGTYQDLIRHLVGTQNASSLKIDQFGGNNSGQNFNLAMLEGKTVNIGDDVQSGVYIDDSSNFNSIITGDPVTVEHKGQMGYVVEFNLTVIQSTNGLPRIKNNTHGTYRRFLIVPFEKQFKEEDVNYKIKENYIKNKEVLEYVLHKAVNMNFEDYTIPTVSKNLLETFKVSNNPVLEFYDEVFKPVLEREDIDRVPRLTVHDMFNQFAEERRYKPMGYNNFKEQFTNVSHEEFEEKQARWIYGDDILRYDIPISSKHPVKDQNSQSYVKK